MFPQHQSSYLIQKQPRSADAMTQEDRLTLLKLYNIADDSAGQAEPSPVQATAKVAAPSAINQRPYVMQ